MKRIIEKYLGWLKDSNRPKHMKCGTLVYAVMLLLCFMLGISLVPSAVIAFVATCIVLSLLHQIRDKVLTTKKNKDMKTTIEKKVEGFENAIISENEESWFVDLRTGLGEAEYSKCDFTLDQAIEDQINWKME